jgi:hypothetical protein
MEKDLRKVKTPHTSIKDAATLKIVEATIIVTTVLLRKSGKFPMLL